MTSSPDPLRRVERATKAKRSADLEYRAALRAARAAGYSYGAIGKAAGISRQGARKLCS